MKKVINLVFILVFIILTGCVVQQEEVNELNDVVESTEIVCNSPYMRFGDGCCLDQNENHICDNDELIQKEEAIIPEETEEEKLEDVARDFARSIEMGDSSEIYDLLTLERQSYKTKSEFMRLYEYVIYGRKRIMDPDEGMIVFNKSYGNYYSSLKFDELEIEGDEGYVKYDITYNNGWDANSGTYYFKKDTKGWSFDGYSSLVYAGCLKDSDCYYNDNQILMNDCEDTCQIKNAMSLKSEEPLVCGNEVCQCFCYEESTRRGKKEYPMWNTIH